MNLELAESIFEEWFNEISKELPSDLVENLRIKIKGNLTELLTGKKSVDKVVSEVDESIIEKIIRSGGKPADFVDRIELLIRILSSKLDKSTLICIIPLITNFQAKILQKVTKIYERIILEEIKLRKRIERALRVLSKVNQTIF